MLSLSPEMSDKEINSNLQAKNVENDEKKKRKGVELIDIGSSMPKPPLANNELERALLNGTRTEPSLLSLQLSPRMALVFHLAFDGTIFKYTLVKMSEAKLNGKFNQI